MSSIKNEKLRNNKEVEPVHERLHRNRTISNLRKCQYFKREKCDYLDFILTSTYNHSEELFPDKEDTFIQKETKEKGLWDVFGFSCARTIPKDDTLGHPIKYGGVSERRSPHNIKLMNSGHHSAKTAPGFSRQQFGGTVYYY